MTEYRLRKGSIFLCGETTKPMRRKTVSAQQSTAYKNVRRYEILSQKLEKLQVSFSRKREETG